MRTIDLVLLNLVGLNIITTVILGLLLHIEHCNNKMLDQEFFRLKNKVRDLEEYIRNRK